MERSLFLTSCASSARAAGPGSSAAAAASSAERGRVTTSFLHSNSTALFAPPEGLPPVCDFDLAKDSTMSFQREDSPLFGSWDASPLVAPGTVHGYGLEEEQQLACVPGEELSLIRLLIPDDEATADSKDLLEVAFALPPLAAPADSLPPHLFIPDEFNPYVVEDLFGGGAGSALDKFDASSASSTAGALLGLPTSHRPTMQTGGPPLVPLASRPRTTTNVFAYSDVNAPDSVPYLSAATATGVAPPPPLSFDRVQDRHAAWDAALGSPLLGLDWSPLDDEEAYPPSAALSAWDGSPALTEAASPLLWSEERSALLHFEGGSGSGSVTPGESGAAPSGLTLFGQLSVESIEPDSLVSPTEGTVPNTNVRPNREASPAFSPVLGPTQLADLQVSPCAPLPPLAQLPLLPPGPSAGGAGAGGDPTVPSSPPSGSVDLAAAAAVLSDSPARSTRSSRRSAPNSTLRSTTTTTTTTTLGTTGSATGLSAASPAPSSSSAATTTTTTTNTYDPSAPRVALDAPIRPRTYTVASRTSAKPVPRNLLLKRTRALARGDPDAPDVDDLRSEAERRRRANTLAARVSRQRKKDEVDGLRKRVGELEMENERLRMWGGELLREVHKLGGGGGGVQGAEGEAERETGNSKKRRVSA